MPGTKIFFEKLKNVTEELKNSLSALKNVPGHPWHCWLARLMMRMHMRTIKTTMMMLSILVMKKTTMDMKRRTATCPICTPFLSSTIAATASSASA